MTARYATPEEIASWNTHILSNPDGGNVFASAEYAKIKRLTAYTPRFVMVDTIAVTVLEKQTFFGRLWYLPKGPGVSSPDELVEVLKALRPLALRRGVFTIRCEAELPATDAPSLKKAGFVKAAPIIPNPSTITLDISADSEALLASLPQKGRHAIRRAGRDGVTVSRVACTKEHMDTMLSLLKETASGQFGLRADNYYYAYWALFEAAGIGQLFFATYEGKVVAGAYALQFGTKSTYKDGASVRERTAYGASHLLQWEVIQWAKEKGASLHDFCGSPPSSEIDNPEHPHYGIGRFKLSLSRQVVDYIGCYDYVIHPVIYRLWVKVGEKIARRWYFLRTKDYYY